MSGFACSLVLQEFQHRCPAAGLLAGIAVDNFF
jgi:hypothetical protein